ncbi:nucleotidyltransferase family protein [Rapidithrix thailandica]|uniref:Nucleotidyltransferase family protein n=1 Tax=Rapidithrix thailandica TaxID=413964 RepID=A0AAW9RX58_9BACT
MKEKLYTIIREDQWMMDVLKTVKNLKLTDCWIGAGFVRNRVWDYLHQKERSELNDIDVIYFNSTNKTPERDQQIEGKLISDWPGLNWSVKNQARMHIKNHHPGYMDCEHALSFWSETATAIAVRLNNYGQLECIAPYGLKDLFNLVVRPTPFIDLRIYKQRIEQKAWKEKWPKLKFFENYEA